MIPTKTETNVIAIRPQPRQEEFLASSADIVIFGGGAFGGKTYALLLEPLRHTDNPKFGCVIFRRTISEITKEGGLWDEASDIYPLIGATPNQQEHSFTFETDSKITFAHMQYDKDRFSWKSAQIALIEFDQLETFESSQFFYMFSRNRSNSGVRPYIRATANPEPGWLADFLDWWIDEDGWAIPERSGVIRWLVREKNQNFWDDNPDTLKSRFPNSTPKSVTFILATIFDNPIGMQNDPDYIGNLHALDYVDRQRLLGDGKRGGNWKVKPAAGIIFNRAWFEIVDAVPAGGKEIRRWDLAATIKKTSDFTASCKGKIVNEVVYILDATNDKIDPAGTDNQMKNTATQDGRQCAVRWEREGGSAGVRDTNHIVKLLAGFDARGIPSTGDKITRAKPLAAQALAGNVKLLRGPWNERWLNHMHEQDGKPSTHDDEMDAASGLYDDLLHATGGWVRTVG